MKKDLNTIAIITLTSIILILGITFLFKMNSYKILFIVENEIYETVNVPKNTSLNNTPRPERQGFAFIGWYDKDGNLFDEKNKINDDSVYYARWATIITEEDN